jgi:uncharacterized protein YgbK (DUF1537 family)
VRSIIIADDLTGACDTAMVMKHRDEQVCVCLPGYSVESVSNEISVWALDTGSRAFPVQEAYDLVFGIVSELKKHRNEETCLYKKIDSVFRGNIASEIEAAAHAWGSPMVLLAPATPAHKRIVLDGCLFTHTKTRGIPLLPLLSFKKGPGYESVNIKEVRKGADSLAVYIQAMQRRGIYRIVVDGETEEDLRITAEASRKLGKDILLSGTSGFAKAVSREQPEKGPASFITKPCRRPVLLALGSCSDVTKKQCRYLLGHSGTASVWISAKNCLQGQAEEEVERACQECEKKLAKGLDALVIAVDSLKNGVLADTKGTGANGEISNKLIVEALGKVIQKMFEHYYFGAMLLSGGDTARQIFEMMGITSIELICELLPGMPLAKVSSDKRNEILLVTKSGGFGETETFKRFFELVTGREMTKEEKEE